jgi:hypothetical protein
MTGPAGQGPRPAQQGPRPGQRDPSQGTRPGQYLSLDEDRPGDPACLLRRVCQACGSVADSDPPTVCPQCGAEMPAA